jgi:hypothetical protein
MGVLGVVAPTFCAGSRPTPWQKPATVEGKRVRLTYEGSSCKVGRSVDVDEGAARVVITVSESVFVGPCTSEGIPRDVEVRLDAPLGGRELVDGTCEMPEYENYGDC